MILLWFVIGMMIAFGIARYNKSNKLFWQLALAFVFGYAANVMYNRVFDDKQDSEDVVQMCPMQNPVIEQCTTNLVYINSNMEPVKVTAFNFASQDFTFDDHSINTIPSEVFGRTRDQPINTLIKPPEELT